MTVQELIKELQRFPPQALIVFEDLSDEPYSYEDVEVEFNGNSEVVIRTL